MRIVGTDTGDYGIIDKIALVIDFFVGLGDMITLFLIRRKIFNLFGYPAFVDLTVWRFQKTVFVYPGKGRHRGNQTDIRTFGCFNRTHSTV